MTRKTRRTRRRWLALPVLFAALGAQDAQLTSGVYASRGLSIRRQATTDLAALDVRVATIARGATLHPARRHDDVEELVIVATGTLRVGFPGQSQALGPGSVTVILPGDDHQLENAGTAPVTCYVFTYRSRAPMNRARGDSSGGSFTVDWNEVRVDSTATGFRRSIFDRPTAMFARFEMHVSTLNEGLTNHAAHTHRAEEFVLMRQGDVRMLVGTRHVTATVGDLIFLASQIPHSLDNTGRGPAEYFAFQGQ